MHCLLTISPQNSSHSHFWASLIINLRLKLQVIVPSFPHVTSFSLMSLSTQNIFVHQFQSSDLSILYSIPTSISFTGYPFFGFVPPLSWTQITSLPSVLYTIIIIAHLFVVCRLILDLLLLVELPLLARPENSPCNR